VRRRCAPRAWVSSCCAGLAATAHGRASRTTIHGGSGTPARPGMTRRPASAYQPSRVQRRSRPWRACRARAAATSTVRSSSSVHQNAPPAATATTSAIDPVLPSSREGKSAVREAAAAGKRITSICSGAFVLAEAGLLQGRSATTYWELAEELRIRYPALDLKGDVLYVHDESVMTSSGYAAGIDLCLHIIRTDYGAAIANRVARAALVAPVRPGGQTQFTQTPLPPERGNACADTRGWAMRHLDKPLTLTDLARHAGVSVRTLTRRFHAESGVSPLQWLLHQRIERAKELLETTTLPMDQVARACGLGTADSLRSHLVRRTGLTPSAYRAQFSRLAPASKANASTVA
jgi:transcriptional regulator GlxA family with amidase domain